MENVIDFDLQRRKLAHSRFYWRMTQCKADEIAYREGVTLSVAQRWVDRFISEKEKEKPNAKKP